MYKTISNKIIRKFDPCYDPSKVITDETEKLSVKEWVNKYRNVLPPKDIVWLLCRKEFMPEKHLRLFAVWCAREALKLVKDPDIRIVEACNVAEKYTNGEATQEELHTVHDANHDVADAAYLAAHYDAYYAAYAAYYASSDADHDITDAAYYATNAAARVAAYAASDAANAFASYAYVTSYAYAAARAAQLDKLLTYFE
jgi:hypothetical protein